MTKVQKLKSELDALSPREKSSIVSHLLRDDELAWAPGVKAAWMDEAEEVSRKVKAGTMRTYSADEVFSALRRRR